VRFLQLANRAPPYWLIVVATITTPLQGLPNLLVYFYPKYMKYRKRHKEMGNLNVIKWIQAGMQTSVPPSCSQKENCKKKYPAKVGLDDTTNTDRGTPPDVEKGIMDEMAAARQNGNEGGNGCWEIHTRPLSDTSSLTISTVKPTEVPRKFTKNKSRRLVSSLTLPSDLETIHETKDLPLAPPTQLASEFSSIAEDDGTANTSSTPERKASNSEETTGVANQLPRRECAVGAAKDETSKPPPALRSSFGTVSDSMPALPRRLFSIFSDGSSTVQQEEASPPASLDAYPNLHPPISDITHDDTTVASFTLISELPLIAEENQTSNHEPLMLDTNFTGAASSPFPKASRFVSIDSMPMLPRRPVSSTGSRDDGESMVTPPRLEGRISDASPDLPRRWELEAESPCILTPTKPFQRHASDESPTLPRRPVSQTDDDDKTNLSIDYDT
jgi:hypothetical protein